MLQGSNRVYTRAELLLENMGNYSVKEPFLPAFLLILLVQVQATRPLPEPATTTKCAASSVEVETVNTGEKAGYDAVFEVTVRNSCPCAVRNVSLRSEGFSSSVAVLPRLFRREGQDYLVGDGRRIETAGEVRFRYAWDRAFRMLPAVVRDDCS